MNSTRLLIILLTIGSMLHATVLKEEITHVKEELFMGTTYKHISELENGAQRNFYYINSKPVTFKEYEDSLLQAEKEQSKLDRRKEQEIRLKSYETEYKARVKIAQVDLKKLVEDLEKQLFQLEDERIKRFMVFSPQTFSSHDQLNTIKNTLFSQAQKLCTAQPEQVNIKTVQQTKKEISDALAKVRDTFIMSVNNGINKADDTKLLKELLALLA